MATLALSGYQSNWNETVANSVLRRMVARELGDEIPSSYLIVTAPDHPLLVEGPDLLIGGEGNLVAVFMPNASDRKMPSGPLRPSCGLDPSSEASR
jgi:hypothetical protein